MPWAIDAGGYGPRCEISLKVLSIGLYFPINFEKFVCPLHYCLDVREIDFNFFNDIEILH
jgi:hypothetical protein